MTSDSVAVSLDMVAAGEAEFRRRFAEKCRGFAPMKAECEAAAIAIYEAMSRYAPNVSGLSHTGVDRG